MSTFSSLFEHGLRDFQGLAIEKLWRDKTYATVRLDFSLLKGKETLKDFKEALFDHLEESFRSFGFCYNSSHDSLLAQLHSWLAGLAPRSLVVLIDEYDAPLTERIDDPQRLHDIFGILSEFFQLLQSSEAALRFLFVTGVCAAGSLASLTRLNDISLRPEFSALLGFTQSEIERRFSAHVQAAASRMNCDELQVLKQLNSRYGGFCFSEEAYERVLCP